MLEVVSVPHPRAHQSSLWVSVPLPLAVTRARISPTARTQLSATFSASALQGQQAEPHEKSLEESVTR